MTTDQKSKTINAAVVIGIGLFYMLQGLWSNRCDYYEFLPKSGKTQCDARVKLIIDLEKNPELREFLERK